MNLSEILHNIIDSSGAILPEICLVAGALLILTFELLYQNKKWKVKTVLHIAILIMTSVLIYSITIQQLSFNGFITNDGLSVFFKYLFLLITGVVLFFPRSPIEIRNRGEYHFLLLTLLLGGFFLIQSLNLLVFYLSLELISISSYILTTFSFKKKGYEAGIKYLLFGALSSGIMLYGISLLYGLSGSLDIGIVVQFVFSNSSTLGWLSLLFFSTGLLFKISLVPMHIWAPDVYEAAPTPLVAVFSAIPKLATLVFLYRVSDFIPIGNIAWLNLLSIIAIISMFIGNLSALWQDNAKRMMAYSSIAHAGFLLIGIIVHTDFGLQSLLFYAIVYALTNVGVFYFINMMEHQGLTNIKQYAGLGKQFSWVGIVMLILMISLTGLPPTGGFTAKLLLFTALWNFYTFNPLDPIFWLFILGLINTVIALFYYLKIPYFMFFKESREQHQFEFSIQNKVFLFLIAAVILIIFFKADWLISKIINPNFVASLLQS